MKEMFVVSGLRDEPARGWVVAAIATALAVGALGWRRPSLALSGTGIPACGSSTDLTTQQTQAGMPVLLRRIAAWWSSLAVHATLSAFAIAILVGLLVIAFLVVPPQADSVWMPRYLGFVWPAFAIAICVLIRRLPLLPVRWAAIVGLLLTNLVVFYHRMELGEPPTALIARDEIAAGDGRNARVFSAVIARPQPGGPGTGGVVSISAAYYYLTMSGTSTTPRGAFEFAFRDKLATSIGPGRPNNLKATLQRDTSVTDAYVWAQLPMTAPEKEFESKIATTLAPDWISAEPMKRWTIYDHWTWKQLYVMERHHWKRAPTTRPTTGPMGAPSKTNNVR